MAHVEAVDEEVDLERRLAGVLEEEAAPLTGDEQVPVDLVAQVLEQLLVLVCAARRVRRDRGR
jgi:hypothetical protein